VSGAKFHAYLVNSYGVLDQNDISAFELRLPVRSPEFSALGRLSLCSASSS
jgi:hypothetical protein